MSESRLDIDRYAPQALIGHTVTGRIGARRYKGIIDSVHGTKERRSYTVDCDDNVIVVRPYRASHTIELASK